MQRVTFVKSDVQHLSASKDAIRQIEDDLLAVGDALLRRRQSLADIECKLEELRDDCSCEKPSLARGLKENDGIQTVESLQHPASRADDQAKLWAEAPRIQAANAPIPGSRQVMPPKSCSTSCVTGSSWVRSRQVGASPMRMRNLSRPAQLHCLSTSSLTATTLPGASIGRPGDEASASRSRSLRQFSSGPSLCSTSAPAWSVEVMHLQGPSGRMFTGSDGTMATTSDSPQLPDGFDWACTAFEDPAVVPVPSPPPVLMSQGLSKGTSQFMSQVSIGRNTSPAPGISRPVVAAPSPAPLRRPSSVLRSPTRVTAPHVPRSAPVEAHAARPSADPQPLRVSAPLSASASAAPAPLSAAAWSCVAPPAASPASLCKSASQPALPIRLQQCTASSATPAAWISLAKASVTHFAATSVFVAMQTQGQGQFPASVPQSEPAAAATAAAAAEAATAATAAAAAATAATEAAARAASIPHVTCAAASAEAAYWVRAQASAASMLTAPEAGPTSTVSQEAAHTSLSESNPDIKVVALATPQQLASITAPGPALPTASTPAQSEELVTATLTGRSPVLVAEPTPTATIRVSAETQAELPPVTAAESSAAPAPSLSLVTPARAATQSTPAPQRCAASPASASPPSVLESSYPQSARLQPAPSIVSKPVTEQGLVSSALEESDLEGASEATAAIELAAIPARPVPTETAGSFTTEGAQFLVLAHERGRIADNQARAAPEALQEAPSATKQYGSAASLPFAPTSIPRAITARHVVRAPQASLAAQSSHVASPAPTIVAESIATHAQGHLNSPAMLTSQPEIYQSAWTFNQLPLKAVSRSATPTPNLAPYQAHQALSKSATPTSNAQPQHALSTSETHPTPFLLLSKAAIPNPPPYQAPLRSATPLPNQPSYKVFPESETLAPIPPPHQLLARSITPTPKQPPYQLLSRSGTPTPSLAQVEFVSKHATSALFKSAPSDFSAAAKTAASSPATPVLLAPPTSPTGTPGTSALAASEPRVGLAPSLATFMRISGTLQVPPGSPAVIPPEPASMERKPPTGEEYSEPVPMKSVTAVEAAPVSVAATAAAEPLGLHSPVSLAAPAAGLQTPTSWLALAEGMTTTAETSINDATHALTVKPVVPTPPVSLSQPPPTSCARLLSEHEAPSASTAPGEETPGSGFSSDASDPTQDLTSSAAAAALSHPVAASSAECVQAVTPAPSRSRVPGENKFAAFPERAQECLEQPLALAAAWAAVNLPKCSVAAEPAASSSPETPRRDAWTPLSPATPLLVAPPVSPARSSVLSSPAPISKQGSPLTASILPSPVTGAPTLAERGLASEPAADTIQVQSAAALLPAHTSPTKTFSKTAPFVTAAAKLKAVQALVLFKAALEARTTQETAEAPFVACEEGRTGDASREDAAAVAKSVQTDVTASQILRSIDLMPMPASMEEPVFERQAD
ncbi:unnamed protein product [Polarella glacialis]|uniref:Uncharacterized protein n=1 Tax=Polarella glacialis TaxID=89957 RepID=A0A813H831_POLGL|nr:unnamed protein product [Polarella glacialis]